MARLSERYGIDIAEHHKQLFGENGLPRAQRTKMPNSHAALNAVEFARERGLAAELHSRLMHALWAEDRDISDPDVLAEEAAHVGLDADAIREVATSLPYEDRIAASTQAVQEMGAGGVPAFVIDDRVLIPGAQPHSLFEKVMQKLGYESVGSTEDQSASES